MRIVNVPLPFLHTGHEKPHNVHVNEILVRTVSDMVIDEPVQPIFVILQMKQTTSGGTDNPTPMPLSVFLLSVYHSYITMSNLNYLFCSEVFIHVMLRAIWFFHWTTC